MKINLRSVLTGMVLVLLLAGVVFFVKRKRPEPVISEKPSASALGVSMGSKVLGPANAPVKFVEYSDFECPSCRSVQTDIHAFFKSYPGKIQLTYKHYPLTSHKWSIYAHQAAECMNAQGKFWAYHDKLYENQQGWALSQAAPLKILMKYADDLGADMDRFGKCMADVAVMRAVYAEKEEGNRMQVSATPTFFLGAERFVGPRELQERGENAVRKVLGLPLKPAPEKQPESLAPAPLRGAANASV